MYWWWWFGAAAAGAGASAAVAGAAAAAALTPVVPLLQSLKMMEAYLTKEHGDLRKSNGTGGNGFYDMYGFVMMAAAAGAAAACAGGGAAACATARADCVSLIRYMDNHVGLLVDDIAPYVEKLQRLNIRFFTRGTNAGIQDVFVEIPG